MWRSTINCRDFRPARHGPSLTGPCVQTVGSHSTVRRVGRAVYTLVPLGLGGNRTELAQSILPTCSGTALREERAKGEAREIGARLLPPSSRHGSWGGAAAFGGSMAHSSGGDAARRRRQCAWFSRFLWKVSQTLVSTCVIVQT